MKATPSKAIKAEDPIALIPERPKAAPFPVAALGPLADVVNEVQAVTQAPVEIAAQSALAACSLAVQGHVDVETLAGNRPTSLFCMTIAQSGERKSSCDNILMQPIFDFERAKLVDHKAEMTDYQVKKDRWDSNKNELIKKGKKLSEADLNAKLASIGPEPPCPRSPDRLVTEPTFEGLTKLLDTGQPSIGIFSDEGGQFLGGHATNRDNLQKTVSAFNGLWDGKPIRRTRGGDGHVTLPGRRVAIHLMAQPDVAQKFLSDIVTQDSGLAARMLVSAPESLIGSRLFKDPPESLPALDTFHGQLSAIMQTPHELEENIGALTPRQITLSSNAKSVLEKHYNKIEMKQAENGKYASLTSVASKSPEQACRIAGVLTAFADLEAKEISGPVMKNAVKLAKFYLNEALRLSQTAAIAHEIVVAEKLRVWLDENYSGSEVTQRIIQQSGPSAVRSKAVINTSIKLLIAHGWLEPVPMTEMPDGKIAKEAYRVIRPNTAT